MYIHDQTMKHVQKQLKDREKHNESNSLLQKAANINKSQRKQINRKRKIADMSDSELKSFKAKEAIRIQNLRLEKRASLNSE